MLSAQTRDEVTWATSRFLIEEKNLSVKTILNTAEKDLSEWIRKVGFRNKKAKYIKEATQIIHEQYGGIVPSHYNKLIKLPGVGPKMIYLLM